MGPVGRELATGSTREAGTCAEDIEEGVGGWEEEGGSLLACVGIPQNRLPAIDTGPAGESQGAQLLS